jgi:hypothetical protein
MKKLFTLLCLLTAAALHAGTALITILDGASQPVAGAKCVITSYSMPQAWNGGTAVKWRTAFYTDAAGQITISNAVAGKWHVDPVDKNLAAFTFYMPATNGVIRAEYSLTASAGNTLPPDTMSYGVNASDRRYARAGSAGTGQTNWPAASITNAPWATTGQLASAISSIPNQWPASSITNKIQLSQLELTLSNSGVTNAICGWMPWWTNNGVVYSIPIVTNVVPPVVTPPDPDVDSFITRSGITNLQEIAAITAFVSALKLDGTWTNMAAIYPFLGGTASRAAVCLQSNVANVSWSGSLTFGNGVVGDGESGYGTLPVGPSDGYNDYGDQSVFVSYAPLEFDTGAVLGAIDDSSGGNTRGVDFSSWNYNTLYNTPYADITLNVFSPKTRSYIQSDYDGFTGIRDANGTYLSGTYNSPPTMPNHYTVCARSRYVGSSTEVGNFGRGTVYMVTVGRPFGETQWATFVAALTEFETTLGR